MNYWLLPVLVPFSCFAFHLLWRGILGAPGQKGIALLVVMVSALAFFQPSPGLAGRLYFFFVAAGYGYAYFHFFNMATTARRIEILIRKMKGDTGTYGAAEMVDRRIARLEQLGAVERRGEEIFLRAGLLSGTSALIAKLRKLFYP